MVTAEELAARAELIGQSPDLQHLLQHLRERAQPVLERMPYIPQRKALLSSNGGVCPDDGAPLTFEPWSPDAHRCPRCDKTWTGERHHLFWARYQHLWISERAAHLATLGALDDRGREAPAARAREILRVYGDRYWQYPNRDNVLGPGRLFFSTYLESLWISNYMAAATLLRASGQLDDATLRAVNQLADEAATLIGDYDERYSNRQTWNNAALAALAVWFEDEELAQRAIEGQTGLLEHLMRGFGRDGTWFEGENYHLFALRGLLMGSRWARLAGVDIAADPRTAARLAAALRAPAISALPDFTFPARKDSRFGLSLGHRAFIELWELGLARLQGGNEEGNNELGAWLTALYGAPVAGSDMLEYYLHDEPERAHRATPAKRTELSWWSLLEMLPDLPRPETPWNPSSVLLPTAGLAILRTGGRYTSLECGPRGGGHGHPDRLHLTLHSDGVLWLPDPGTGSYVARKLFWYRSTLAHNAPRLDGQSQQDENATCESFEEQEDWAWVRGRYGNLQRRVVVGPIYIVDVLELTGSDDHVLELPWHVGGTGDVENRGRWVRDELPAEFVTRVERFEPDGPGPIVIAHAAPGARLTAHLLFDGNLIRAEGPGLPGGERQTFYVARARGRNVRMVAVLEPSTADPQIRAVRASGERVEIETQSGTERHGFTGTEWTIEQSDGTSRVLRGPQDVPPPFRPYLELDVPVPVTAPAFRVERAPPLDGTTDGFETSEPFQLAMEDQYRRGEDAYPGPEDLSATGYAAWDESALYVAVEVTKPDLCFRATNAAPLALDNESDDIHSDGLQVYVAGDGEGAEPVGYLVVPEPDSRRVRVSPTSDTSANGDRPAVRGAWQRTDSGYRVTLAIPWPATVRPHAGARVRFDLIVNEMLPGRLRRVGQLVWSGGGGWVWLRGDRQDQSRFGVLELVG